MIGEKIAVIIESTTIEVSSVISMIPSEYAACVAASEVVS
tara:strand:- start:15 stop:134 length:120 start_codon:yes stop_codon:yes gene_type:complete